MNESPENEGSSKRKTNLRDDSSYELTQRIEFLFRELSSARRAAIVIPAVFLLLTVVVVFFLWMKVGSDADAKIKSMSDRMDSSRARIDGFADAATALSAQIGKTSESYSLLSNRIAIVEQQVANTSVLLGSNQAAIDSINKKIDSQQLANSNALEGIVNSNQQAFQIFSNKWGADLEKRLGTFDEKIGKLQTDLTKLDSSISTNISFTVSNRLLTLYTNDGSNSIVQALRDIGDLKSSNSKLTSNLNSLSKIVTDFSNAVPRTPSQKTN